MTGAFEAMHDVTSYDRNATFRFYRYRGLKALRAPAMSRRKLLREAR
jgi:hypothetical protein